MKLVIGGYAQGKLNYVLEHYGGEECQVWDGEMPGNAERCREDGHRGRKAEKPEEAGDCGGTGCGVRECGSAERAQDAGSGAGEPQRIVLNHLHSRIRQSMAEGGCPEEEIGLFLEKNPDSVIISDEVGCGIVPADAFEREYRERTGRILVELARQAEEVVRVICGIGQKIK